MKNNQPTLYRTDIIMNNNPVFFYAAKTGRLPPAGMRLIVFSHRRDININGGQYRVRFFPQSSSSTYASPANAFKKYSPEQMPPMVWPHYPVGDTVINIPPYGGGGEYSGGPYTVRVASEVGEVGIPALSSDGRTYLVRPGELFLVLPLFAFFAWTGGQNYGQWLNIEYGNVHDAIVANWDEVEYINEILQPSGQSVTWEWRYINTFCSPGQSQHCPPYYGTRGYGCYCGGGSVALSIYMRHALLPVQYYDGNVWWVQLPSGVMVFPSPTSRDLVYYRNLPLPYQGATPPEDDLYVYAGVSARISYSPQQGYSRYRNPYDCWAISCGDPPEEIIQLQYCVACEGGNGKKLMYAEWRVMRYTGLLSLNEYLQYLNNYDNFCDNLIADCSPVPPDPELCWSWGPC